LLIKVRIQISVIIEIHLNSEFLPLKGAKVQLIEIFDISVAISGYFAIYYKFLNY